MNIKAKELSSMLAQFEADAPGCEVTIGIHGKLYSIMVEQIVDGNVVLHAVNPPALRKLEQAEE